MEIKNNVIVSLDKKDKNLVIPKSVVGMDYEISDLCAIDGFESIVVEEGKSILKTMKMNFMQSSRKPKY